MNHPPRSLDAGARPVTGGQLLLRPRSRRAARRPWWSFAGSSLLILGLLFGAGCVQRYRITLTSGTTIDTKSKPKFDANKTAYVFKDDRGQPARVPAFKVREIAPR
jgi:hypothetical protein